MIKKQEPRNKKQETRNKKQELTITTNILIVLDKMCIFFLLKVNKKKRKPERIEKK